MQLPQIIEYLSAGMETAVVLTDNRTGDEGGPSILYANDAFCSMSGYSKEEVLGNTPRMLQGKETNSRRTQALGRAVRKGEMHHTMFVNYRKNGEKYHCEICAFPIEDAQGDITHFIAFEREAHRKPGRPKTIHPNDFWWIPDWSESLKQ